MITAIQLPDGSAIDIEYDEKVYDPNYSSYRDTIGMADACIKEVNPSRVLDVGCGSGVIGLAIKKLHPLVDVYLSDNDERAIKQTKKNAKMLKLNVTVLRSDLLPKTRFFPVVVANLPTFDEEQIKTLPLHGPKGTYEGGGLDLYKKLISQIPEGTFLICEIQKKFYDEFQEFIESKDKWQIIMRSASGFALLHA
jgi:methylase of polypeptide subunit release factors